MKRIELKRVELRNFKGVTSADYDFHGVTSISGGNGSGKSTIYEAYLWCLFNKNQYGNTMNVQPLDENNDVKHQLTTSVKLTFAIDGNPLIVERSIKERWVKPHGKKEQELYGTTSEYAINEVPMKQMEFIEKLHGIIPLDRWFAISSISILPNMDQMRLRVALQDIAPSIDEMKIAALYPAVLDAFNAGNNVDELAALTKKNKQVAQKELDDIPAAIDAQDRLRVDLNWADIERKIAITEASIAATQKSIEDKQRTDINDEDINKVNELFVQLNAEMSELSDIEKRIRQEYYNEQNKIYVRISNVNASITSVNGSIALHERISQQLSDDIERNKGKMQQYRDAWLVLNYEQYDEPDITTICPACGQPLPAERVNDARQKAREEWNEKKQARLASIQRDAESAKASIDKAIQDSEKNKEEADKQIATLAGLQEQLAELQKTQNESQKNTLNDMLEQDLEYQAQQNKVKECYRLIDEYNNSHKVVEAEKAKQTIAEDVALLTSKIRELESERKELFRQLAKRETNERIEQQRIELEKRQFVLADLIAQYEGTESQIAAFRKARITAVENGVSQLFTMVRWKMYEQNVTNDGEKEICQAIIDGIPYNEQNKATQVNAAIDIVNGFSTAYDVSVPLFIDNAESVTNPLPSIGQQITLTVIPGAALSITSNN